MVANDTPQRLPQIAQARSFSMIESQTLGPVDATAATTRDLAI